MARINGTARDDRLVGTKAADVLSGGAGDDLVFGAQGNDTITVGTGNDEAHGGAGNDVFRVTEYDEASPDRFFGDGGHDVIDLSRVILSDFVTFDWDYVASSDTFTVENFFGEEVILRFTGIEEIIGSRDDDRMHFEDVRTALTIDTGTGHDFASGGKGNDTINGGVGDDDLYGGGGRDLLFGGQGDDYLSLDSDGRGRMDGGGGRDTGVFYGSVDLDRGVALNGLGERQTVANIEDLQLFLYRAGSSASGSAGANVIDAGYSTAAVTLNGRGGQDELTGGSGDDRLDGGDDSDVLTGGNGSDRLTGGSGADRFVMSVPSGIDQPPPIRDTITDFSQAEHDVLDLAFVDAIPDEGGIDAFRFLSKAAFDGEAGVLRYGFEGGTTIIQADFDGDRVADFEIRLFGRIELHAGDFTNVNAPAAAAEVAALI